MTINFREAKQAGLNPRWRKLKKDVRHAGGLYAPFVAGSRVLVLDARNQPDWQEKKLVFLDQDKPGTCEMLVSLNEGFVNP